MKEQVAKIIGECLKELKVKFSETQIISLIETPPNSSLGDFAFPCFPLSPIMKMSPNEIAIQLRSKIKKKPKGFDSIESSGPYLNFFVDRKSLAKDLVHQIIEEGEDFGKTDIGKGEKVLVEHTSINPNASPHVGRTRNAIIGDSLVKILQFLNFNPEVHYYVNDVSKQIAMLVLADADKLKFESMLKKYIEISGKVKKSKKLEQEVFKILNLLEKNNPEIKEKFRKITETCVKGQAKILSQIGIEYNVFDYESDYLEQSREILSQLEKTGKLVKDDVGRLVLNQEGTSVENKMKAPFLVLTRNDGTGLYPLRDLAYTLHKMSLAKKNLLVLGEDQKLYFEQLKEALKLLHSESPDVVHYSFVLLKEKGKTKKMATRSGDVVLLEDFLKDAIKKAQKEIKKRKTKGDPSKVGVGAVKYSILKNNANRIILFNLEDSLSFEGDTGPYLQYTYARASSILKKSKIKKIEEFEIDSLEEKEMELIKKLSEFKNVVEKSFINLNPSFIANYSYQLAKIFNEFYHSCPVIGSPNENFRLGIVVSVKQVLKNSLGLLGIDVLEQM